MIESNLLPQNAIDYLNEIEKAKNNQALQSGRIGARQELLNFCVQWYTTAQVWRKQSFEDDWLQWQRNADGRYDPRLAQKKKDWQAKSFVDLTPSHRESIQAELFRLVAGSRPILDVTARPGGDPDQAEDMRDITLREMEKSKFEVEYNKILEDKTTYGSGFCRIYWEEKVEDRPIRVPIVAPVDVNNPMSIQAHMSGQPPILGYRTQIMPKTIYRGVQFRHVPIWDFFIDPKGLQIKGNTCLFRSRIHLQEVIDQIRAGNFMPESGKILREAASNEIDPPDKSLLRMERGISDTAPRREGYQSTWEYYELYGRLPQKWVYPLLKEPLPITDADSLIAARVIFHKQTIFAVELNDDYEAEPPFYKDDYLPVAMRFYGRGIPEMLKNPQGVINEVVNQRLDEGNLALQEGFIVVQKAILNPEDLLSGGPGLIIRADEKKLGPNGDVRNILMPLGRPDVKINAGFSEVHEWERMATNRTSADRTSIASNNISRDSGRTLGGMQILKQSAGEKFAFIAMLSEFNFLHEVFRAYWKVGYSNFQPQDIVASLGQERAQSFQLLSPEEVDMGYKYEPKGIFEREAKAEGHARLQALYEQFKGAPWMDNLAFFDQEAKWLNVDPARLKVPEAEATEIMGKAQQMAEPLAKQMLTEILLGQAVKDVEKNLAEKLADSADSAKQREVSDVPNLGSADEDRKI